MTDRTGDKTIETTPAKRLSEVPPPTPESIQAPRPRVPCGGPQLTGAAWQPPIPLLGSNRPNLPAIFTSGPFTIHYTVNRNSPDMVYDPSSCGPSQIVATGDPGGQVLATTDPGTNVPSYIQRIAFWLNQALARYQAAQFPDPLSRWPRIEVYVWKVVDSAGDEVRGLAGGGCLDIHNDMMTGDDALRTHLVQHVCCHELFHLVQDMLRFDAAGNQIVNLDLSGFSWVEGLAELAPDFVNGWANAWMAHWRLDVPTNVVPLTDPAMDYDACLFWRYVCDRFSVMSKVTDGWFFGADIMRELLLMAQPGTTISWDLLLAWVNQHPEAPPARATPGASHPPGVGVDYFTLAGLKWPLRTLEALNRLRNHCPPGVGVYSDWLVANIVQDFGNASSKRWFGYADRDEPPGLPHSQAIYVSSAAMPSGIAVNPWTWRYYALDLSKESCPLHLTIKVASLSGAAGATPKPNLQVVITDGFRVVDVVRSSGDLDTVLDTTWAVLPGLAGPIRDVFIIFAAEDVGAQYSISLSP